MNWITINDRAVNLNQVTDVDFMPASSGFDEEEQREYSHQAKVLITLTSVEVESKERNYDGEFQGVASASRQIAFYGEDAEAFWQQFQFAVGINELVAV